LLAEEVRTTSRKRWVLQLYQGDMVREAGRKNQQNYFGIYF